MRAAALRWGLVGALALLAACAAPQATQEERAAFDLATARLDEDPQETARRLEVFLREHHRSPLSEEAAWLRSQIALDEQDRSRAVFWLGWMVRNHPRGVRSDDARVQLARLHARTGDDEMAREVLEGVRMPRLAPEQRRLAYRLRADVASDPAERVQWLAAARRAAAESGVSGAALELMDVELAGAVDELDADGLERAQDLLDGRPPAGRVALRLARARMDQGRFEDAGQEIRAAGRLELAEADRRLLEELSLRMEVYDAGRGGEGELLPTFAEVAAHPVPDSSAARGTLGVVLPLSGPYASYGEESLRGVLLAARIFGGSGGGDVRVVVRDSGGDPLRAASAVRELARLDELMAVVGPLRSGTSEAAARVAEDEGLPLIALTNRESVARERPFVFRLRTTPEDELRYLIDYTFREIGARRFGVLYPDDGYGRGMRDHFWDMVRERGGWLVAASSYEPGATDFGDPIRAMIGYALLTRSERSALVERENFLRRGRRLPAKAAVMAREIADGMIGPEGEPLPPIVDFDAVFIPDGYERIGLIAPQLAFHELTGVQLLGVGDWYHPELIEIAQEHVSGAVISALFDPNSRFPFVSDFVQRYRDAFGSEPDGFSAHSYDAANLVLVQLARGFESREAVREGLLRMQAYPGASGVTSLGADGNARKRPFLLQVRGSKIVPLD